MQQSAASASPPPGDLDTASALDFDEEVPEGTVEIPEYTAGAIVAVLLATAQAGDVPWDLREVAVYAHNEMVGCMPEEAGPALCLTRLPDRDVASWLREVQRARLRAALWELADGKRGGEPHLPSWPVDDLAQRLSALLWPEDPA